MSGLLPVVVIALAGAVAFSLGKKKGKKASGSGGTKPLETVLVRGTGRSGDLGLCDFEILEVSKRFTARYHVRSSGDNGLLDMMTTQSAVFLELTSVLQFVSEPPFDLVEEGTAFAGAWGAEVRYEVTRDQNGLWGWNATRTGPLALQAGRYPYLWLPMFGTQAQARQSLQVELQLIEITTGQGVGLGQGGGVSPSPQPKTPTIPPYVAQPGPPPNLPPPLFSVQRYPDTHGVPLPGLTRSDGIVFSENCQVAGVGPMFWDRLGDFVEGLVGQGFTADEIMMTLDEDLFAGITIATCLGPRLLRREIENRLTTFIRETQGTP